MILQARLQAVTFTVEYFHSLLLLKLGLTFKGAIYPWTLQAQGNC